MTTNLQTILDPETILQEDSLSAIIILHEIRCPKCGKLVCEASGIVRKKCDRCKNWFTIITSKPSASE